MRPERDEYYMGIALAVRERANCLRSKVGAVLVLEELSVALARGADIIAEVIGYGASGDAFHITQPIESGEGAARAMTMAFKRSGIDVLTNKEVKSTFLTVYLDIVNT